MVIKNKIIRKDSKWVDYSTDNDYSKYRHYQLTQGMVNNKGIFKGFVSTDEIKLEKIDNTSKEKYYYKPVDKDKEQKIKLFLTEQLKQRILTAKTDYKVKPYRHIIGRGFLNKELTDIELHLRGKRK